MNFVRFASIVFLSTIAYCVDDILPRTIDYNILINDRIIVQFDVKNRSLVPLEDAEITLSASPYLEYERNLRVHNNSFEFELTGKRPVSRAIVEVINCTLNDSEKHAPCPLGIKDAFVRVSVVRSKVIEFLVELVGWTYFFAWSISFYPQMILNYQRKSVVGLNFDFLALNVLGFGAYSLFNLLMYFNDHVKDIYHHENPHSPSPVLPNDIVFAVHAFFACCVTVIQCYIYERQEQSVSKKCIFLIIGLSSFGVLTACLAVLDKITILAFVTSLSYIKMAVTCCKYFPQAIFNYQRKSTVGWSIGNILLDFTGGFLDIVQMILQAVNVDDWSGFYGNPVKFGLGLVSILFDIVFIVQHYVLYRDSETIDTEYEGVDSSPESTANLNEDPVV